MKNRIPITTNHKTYLTDIINAKNSGARKDLLNANLNFILAKYTAYRAAYAVDNLQSLTAVAHTKDLHDALLHCYGVEVSPLSELKIKLRIQQGIELQGICPYCTVNKPDETDHYVAEKEFPEFAVLALNLVPCCASCNKKKGKWWRDDAAQRIFLNFYLDTIPLQRYLKISLTFKKLQGDLIPVGRFSLDFTLTGPMPVVSIIKTHYKKLDLLKKFSDAVADEFAELRRSLLAFDFPDIDSVKEHLAKRAVSEARDGGTNYWRAIYFEALSVSDKFATEFC
jgi:hypothetical protein